MRSSTVSFFAFVLFALSACGSDAKKEPSTSADAPSVPESASAAPTNEPAPAQAAPAKKKRPYEIINLCPRPATIIFGEDPKAPGAGSRTLAGNDKIDEGPRDNDGNEVIHLMVRNEPLVRVRVSRGTKRVEIGTSCDTLEMH